MPFFFCSPASAAAVVCPAGSCLSSSHLSQFGQHTICDNSFLRINICSGCVPVLLPCPFLPLATLLPDRLRFCLPRCPPCPDLPFVYSVCFRTLFKLTCAYFLMVSRVCMWLLLLCLDPRKVSVHCDLKPLIIIFNSLLIVLELNNVLGLPPCRLLSASLGKLLSRCENCFT